MYIFIKNTAFAKAVQGITLKDGYLPVILNNTKPITLPENIESAIWFKVLVLDFIIVDCGEKSIQYNIRGSRIDDNGHRGPDGIVSTRQNPEEIDLECFFISLNKQLKCQAKGEISNDEFHTALLRLLHCYVLPLVTFQQKHIHAIEKAYDDEKAAINLLDHDIDLLSTKLHDLQQHYNEIIYSFRHELADEDTNLHLYSRNFLVKIISSIEKLLREIRTDLDIRQNCVERIKEFGSDEMLEENRNDRNYVFDKLLHLTAARENISQYLAGKKKKVFKGCFGILPDTSDKVDKFEKAENDLAFLTDKLLEVGRHKVQATSVKEAIHCLIEDLKAGGEYVGLETDNSGARATDVFTIFSSPCEWLTLKEQVSSILQNSSHPVAKMHKEFCQIFKNKCVVSEFEQRIFRPWDTLHKMFPSATDFSSDQSASELSSSGDISDNNSTSKQNETLKISENKVVLRQTKVSKRWSLRRRKGMISSDESVISPKEEMDEIFPNMQTDNLNPMQKLSEPVVLRKITHRSNSRRITEDDFVFVNTFNLNQLKEYLHFHMLEMCAKFQKLIAKDDAEISLPCLWICYENHICSEIFPSLINLYAMIYSDPCKKLKNINTITWCHLNVDEKFLQDLCTSNYEYRESLEDLTCYSPVYNTQFKFTFLNVINTIKSLIKTTSIIAICKMLASSLRLINQKLSKKSATADDLITILTLVLLHCEPQLVSQLYIILNLLMNLLPDFLEKGVYGYTLATYLMVYQFFFSSLNKLQH